MNQFFEPQELVFDITLCGGQSLLSFAVDMSQFSNTQCICLIDYAGNQDTFLQTCSGLCYDDWVLGTPSNFDTAYFEVQYVRVYGLPGQLTVISRAYRSADIAALFTLVATLFSVMILLT